MPEIKKAAICEEIETETVEETTQITDSLQQYFKDISKTPLLKPEEEKELGYKIINGIDVEFAINELVRHNLRLVVSNAKTYIGFGLDFEDLIAEGNIGLMMAAKKFDISKGCRFSTYATYWIKQSISRAVDNQARTIRLPVHKLEELRKIKKAESKLLAEMGREVSIDELASYLDQKPEEIERCMQESRELVSLDVNIGEDGDTTLSDTLEDKRAISPEELSIMRERRAATEKVLSMLSSKEGEILRMRNGFYGEVMTLEEIGKIYGVSRERIRQIESKAINKIKRSPSMRRSLEAFID